MWMDFALQPQPNKLPQVAKRQRQATNTACTMARVRADHDAPDAAALNPLIAHPQTRGTRLAARQRVTIATVRAASSMAEQVPFKHMVAGSNPAWPTENPLKSGFSYSDR